MGICRNIGWAAPAFYTLSNGTLGTNSRAELTGTAGQALNKTCSCAPSAAYRKIVRWEVPKLPDVGYQIAWDANNGYWMSINADGSGQLRPNFFAGAVVNFPAGGIVVGDVFVYDTTLGGQAIFTQNDVELDRQASNATIENGMVFNILSTGDWTDDVDLTVYCATAPVITTPNTASVTVVEGAKVPIAIDIHANLASSAGGTFDADTNVLGAEFTVPAGSGGTTITITARAAWDTTLTDTFTIDVTLPAGTTNLETDPTKYVFVADAPANANVTLIAPTDCQAHYNVITIRRGTAQIISVRPDTGDTVDGGASYAMPLEVDAVTFIRKDADWISFGNLSNGNALVEPDVVDLDKITEIPTLRAMNVFQVQDSDGNAINIANHVEPQSEIGASYSVAQEDAKGDIIARIIKVAKPDGTGWRTIIEETTAGGILPYVAGEVLANADELRTLVIPADYDGEEAIAGMAWVVKGRTTATYPYTLPTITTEAQLTTALANIELVAPDDNDEQINVGFVDGNTIDLSTLNLKRNQRVWLYSRTGEPVNTLNIRWDNSFTRTVSVLGIPAADVAITGNTATLENVRRVTVYPEFLRNATSGVTRIVVEGRVSPDVALVADATALAAWSVTAREGDQAQTLDNSFWHIVRVPGGTMLLSRPPQPTIFAPSNAFTAASVGNPTNDEIETWANTQPLGGRDRVITYNGTPTATDNPTHVWFMDVNGQATILKAPAVIPDGYIAFNTNTNFASQLASNHPAGGTMANRVVNNGATIQVTIGNNVVTALDVLTALGVQAVVPANRVIRQRSGTADAIIANADFLPAGTYHLFYSGITAFLRLIEGSDGIANSPVVYTGATPPNPTFTLRTAEAISSDTNLNTHYWNPATQAWVAYANPSEVVYHTGTPAMPTQPTQEAIAINTATGLITHRWTVGGASAADWVSVTSSGTATGLVRTGVWRPTTPVTVNATEVATGLNMSTAKYLTIQFRDDTNTTYDGNTARTPWGEGRWDLAYVRANNGMFRYETFDNAHIECRIRNATTGALWLNDAVRGVEIVEVAIWELQNSPAPVVDVVTVTVTGTTFVGGGTTRSAPEGGSSGTIVLPANQMLTGLTASAGTVQFTSSGGYSINVPVGTTAVTLTPTFTAFSAVAMSPQRNVTGTGIAAGTTGNDGFPRTVNVTGIVAGSEVTAVSATGGAFVSIVHSGRDGTARIIVVPNGADTVVTTTQTVWLRQATATLNGGVGNINGVINFGFDINEPFSFAITLPNQHTTTILPTVTNGNLLSWNQNGSGVIRPNGAGDIVITATSANPQPRVFAEHVANAGTALECGSIRLRMNTAVPRNLQIQSATGANLAFIAMSIWEGGGSPTRGAGTATATGWVDTDADFNFSAVSQFQVMMIRDTTNNRTYLAFYTVAASFNNSPLMIQEM